MGNVLVTAIGSFSAHTVIDTLKELGHKVCGCDIYPREWIASSADVDVFYQSPYASDESYVNFILEKCEENSVKWVMPLTDVEVDVLNKNREVFDDRGIVLCISDQEVIELCRNKFTLSKFIEENGKVVDTIPTYRASELGAKDIKLPVICKPFNGRSSIGLQIIGTPDDLESVLSDSDAEFYIIQPFVKGSVVTVDVVRDRADNCVAVARKELLRTLNGAGTSVHVFHDEELEQKSKDLARLLKITGCVNFEFILDKDGNYHFLECNPRFSGGVVFSCMAGYSCVANHLRAFKGEQIEPFALSRNYYIARRYESHIMSEEDL